jgi:hypothetical protein
LLDNLSPRKRNYRTKCKNNRESCGLRTK